MKTELNKLKGDLAKIKRKLSGLKVERTYLNRIYNKESNNGNIKATHITKILDELKGVSKQCGSLENEIKSIVERVTELTCTISVTDHAVVRYLERHYGLDIDDLKSEMLGGDVRSLYAKFGNGEFAISGGMKAVIKDGTVVTVLK